MEAVWPFGLRVGHQLSDDDLEGIYSYPEDVEEPWVQVNFVASVDGVAAVDGVSAGLGHPADQRLFHLARDLADVILVGATTAVAEGYRGERPTAEGAARRRRLGLSVAPPIAVVTGTARFSPESPLVTDTVAPLIVITCASAAASRRAALISAGVDVIVAGDEHVDLRIAVAALGDRGLRRVDCEGGPRLFGDLVALDLVDQMCLTMSPMLAGGGARHVGGGAVSTPRALSLASVLTEDGLLFLRYRRRRDDENGG
ncbi:pyrimidine reductase family protein [Amycolatopsis minnesotensis]|uniref:Pyrimidine reductase family protein n=1 Tax=Amycolatopsis minnesotensis TaxID=337894 RepID=A0ABP5DP80_9PSEU